MFKTLWSVRYLIWQLIYRDISVKYRQSYLGYLWALFPQLATASIFTFLASKRVFDMGDTFMPYVLHALWSVSLWQLFSTSIVNCTNSLVVAGPLVTKINFPKESLVIASLGQPLLDFCIRLIPITIAMVWLGFIPSINTIYIVPVVFFVLLLALGIGLLFSILNLIVRDMGNAVSMIMTFGMFLSPILYPPPTREPFDLINVINPFSPLLISTQELLSGSQLSSPILLVIISILATILCFTSLRVFNIAIPRIVERA